MTSPESGRRSPARRSKSRSWPWPSSATIPRISPARRLEGDAVDLIARTEGRSPRGDVSRFAAGPGVRSARRDVPRRLLAEHRLHQARLTTFTRNHAGDVAAVAQDGRPVAHPEHLGQAMGDEEHRPTLVHPVPHHGEDMLRLIGGKGGGDLVEQEQLRVVGQRPGEVEQPQDLERKFPDETVEVEIAHVHRLQPRSAPTRIDPGEAEVLIDRQIRNQRRILEHGGQSGCHRIGRACGVKSVPH